MQSFQRPGTQELYGQQMMETVNEQNQPYFEQDQEMDEMDDEEQIYQRDDEEQDIWLLIII